MYNIYIYSRQMKHQKYTLHQEISKHLLLLNIPGNISSPITFHLLHEKI